MIIFSGLGFLPIAFLILFGIAFGAGHQGGASHDSGLASALFFAGIASGLSGWWLHNRPARTVIDKATGKELVLRRRHALFFVPLMYWGPIFIAMAIYQFCTVQR